MGSTPRFISASRGAAIFGFSEFMTPLEVFQEIEEELHPGWNAEHGYILPEKKDSPPLRWGTAFEPAVISLAEEATRGHIIDRERLYTVPGYDFITCHIDGMYINKPGTLVVHEGKTTNSRSYHDKWDEPGTDKIPRVYQVQTQTQMLCTGAEKDIVSVLVFPDTPENWEKLGWVVHTGSLGQWQIWKKDNQSESPINPEDWARVLSQMGYFHQFPVAANPAVQKSLIEGYEHFWNARIIPGIPPDPKDYDDIKRLFPEPKGTLVCPPEIASIFSEIKSINEEIGDGGSLAKRAAMLKVKALDWARKQDGEIDEESRVATIFRDETGKKLGQYAKQKNGVLMFRAS